MKTLNDNIIPEIVKEVIMDSIQKKYPTITKDIIEEIVRSFAYSCPHGNNRHLSEQFVDYYQELMNDKIDAFFIDKKEITDKTLSEFAKEMEYEKFGDIRLLEERRIDDCILDTYMIALVNKKRALKNKSVS